MAVVADFPSPCPQGRSASWPDRNIRALASMRWSMFRNSLRTTQGAIELGARTIAFFFYALLGFGMAAGFGGGAYAIAASEKWEILPALFWVLFILWQVVPVTLASFQEHFDIGGLLRFPVGFGAFFFSISFSAWWMLPRSWAAFAASASGSA